MNILEMSSLQSYILGLYIIFHGAIHIVFYFNYLDKEKNVFTGWSRKSWILDKYFSTNIVKIIGYLFWTAILVSFTIAGLFTFEIITLKPEIWILTASIISIIGYILFYNGMLPTPYHWILGMVIDIILVIFMLINTQVIYLLITLGIVTIYGMLFHIKIVSSLVGNKPIVTV